MATNKDWKNWRKQTLAVRGGQRRTPFQETSEALFMTAGYAYEGAEEAEERFKGAARIHLYALREPDGLDVRGAHGAARRGARGAVDRRREWRRSRRPFSAA